MGGASSISSMTGFARASGGDGAAGWSWEVKSVNGRALDIRCRLPQGMERLDPAVRGAVSARLRRGNVTVGLRLSQAPEAAAMRVNRAWLDELIALAAEYRGTDGIAPPRLDGMLALRGVIETAESPDDAECTQDDGAILETLDVALAELVRERQAEGAALAAALTQRIEEIVALTGQAEALAPSRQDALGERLREQVSALIGAGSPVSEDRLVTELALLAVKIDVTRRSTGSSPIVRRRRASCRRRGRSGASSISWHRSSTGRPIRSAPRPPVQHSRRSASLSRPPSTSSVSRRKTSSRR